jgi:hypothetical protein
MLFALFVVATILIVMALTSGGGGFRWFGNTVKDVSDDIAETLDLLNQATQDIKSASHTIRKTGTKIKDIAEETSKKASVIVNSTEVIVEDIKNAVSDIRPAGDKQKQENKSEKKRKRTATKDDKHKKPQ